MYGKCHDCSCHWYGPVHYLCMGTIVALESISMDLSTIYVWERSWQQVPLVQTCPLYMYGEYRGSRFHWYGPVHYICMGKIMAVASISTDLSTIYVWRRSWLQIPLVWTCSLYICGRSWQQIPLVWTCPLSLYGEDRDSRFHWYVPVYYICMEKVVAVDSISMDLSTIYVWGRSWQQVPLVQTCPLYMYGEGRGSRFHWYRPVHCICMGKVVAVNSIGMNLSIIYSLGELFEGECIYYLAFCHSRFVHAFEHIYKSRQ